MARNTEKAMTALARWRAAFEEKGGMVVTRKVLSLSLIQLN